MINGTTGIMGASDGAIVMQASERGSNQFVLNATGRDIPNIKISISQDPVTRLYSFIESDNELWRPERDDDFDLILSMLKSFNGSWEGPASELAALLKTDTSPTSLSMKIRIKQNDLKKGYGIGFKSSRNHSGRILKLNITGEKTVGFRKDF